MDFLEKDLEEIIFNASEEDLEDKGLAVYGKRYRQVRIGNYGIADMVTAQRWYFTSNSSGLKITVYELKKDKIGISAFLQALKYVRGIKSYFEHRGYNNRIFFEIVLVGRTLDTDGSLCFLTDFINPDERGYGEISRLDFYTYSYDFNGISFNEHSGYDLTKKGF